MSLADASPAYEALSYVWGNPTVTLPILLDGQDFQVTANLASALRHLRYHDRNRTLWIDAMCINQKDIGECGTQVHQMLEIFRKAQEVIVWLCPKTEQLAKAMDQILELGSAGHLSSMPKYQLCDHNRYNFQGHIEEAFDALHEFMDCPWFCRLWVIQEIVLARTARIHCGDRYLAWEDFSRFTAWLQCHKNCCTGRLPSSDAFTMTIAHLRTEKAIHDLDPPSCSWADTGPATGI